MKGWGHLLKRLLILLAAVLLLSSCAARYDYQNGVALRLREIKGDKYTAEIWVEVAFEDGSRPEKIEADVLDAHGDNVTYSRDILQYPEGLAPNVAVLVLKNISVTPVINNKGTLKIENIHTDSKDYSGKWELAFTVNNKDAAKQFAAVSKASDGGLTIDKVEISPYSIHLEIKGKKLKTEQENWGQVELLLSNREKAVNKWATASLDADEPYALHTTSQFMKEIEISAVKVMILDGVEYTLTKV